MSLAKLTLTGMWQYFKSLDDNKDLFDNLTLPDGIDKDTLMENILLNGGEFETLYGDPWFMRDAIGTWSRKWQRTFEKWMAALSIEYNPLENYDRMENWSDQLNRGASSSSRRDSGNTRTFNNTDKETIDTDVTSENTVSAFDSSTYQPSDKNTTNNDGTDTFEHTGTIQDAFGEGASASEKENSKNEHDGRIHGNVGVTQSQKMLADELEVQRFNIIEQITDLFVTELCIMVYE